MKRRILSLLLALCMVLVLLPGTAQAANSGTCGEKATWKLSGGTLTISGSGKMADYGTWNNDVPWASQCQQVKTVVVGNGITSIGNSAFSGCSLLARVTLPNSLTDIGNRSFYGCSQLTSITIPSKVKNIGEYAFSNCSKLTKVSIPASVISIGTMAFEWGGNLKEVNYGGTETQWNKILIHPTGNNILFLKINYSGSPNTQTVVSGNLCKSDGTSSGIIWSLSKNGILTFSGSGDMPNYTPWIYHRQNITSLNLDSKITRIGASAFYRTSLTSVIIPGNISSVGMSAFQYCRNLTKVTILEGVTSLDGGVFASCYNLSSIYIPVSMTFIGADTFYECNELTDIYYAGTKAQWEDILLNCDIPETCKIHYNSSGTVTKTYKITLDANGGEVSPGSIQAEAKKPYLDNLPTPTREGYKFDGWYTSKTGTTKITATTKATYNRTIYAHWSRARTYLTVTLDPNGGTVYQDKKVLVAGASYKDLPTPTRPNYIFNGWYTAKSGGKQVTSATRSSASAATQTLYAHWKASATAKSTTKGSWTVSVPPYFELPLYGTTAAAKIKSIAPEKGDFRDIPCTKKATLSTGVVRYYGKVDGKYAWFTYSCEMDVD